MEQEDEEFFKKEYVNCGQVIPLIFELEDNCPDKRKIKEYTSWKNKINFLYLQYNKLADFKAFKII